MNDSVDFGVTAETSPSAGSPSEVAVVVKTGAVASVLRMLLVHAEAGVDLKESTRRAGEFLGRNVEVLDPGQQKRWLSGAAAFAKAIGDAKDEDTLLGVAQHCRASLSLIQEAVLTVQMSEILDPSRRAGVLRAILVEFPAGPDEMRQ